MIYYFCALNLKSNYIIIIIVSAVINILNIVLLPYKIK